MNIKNDLNKVRYYFRRYGLVEVSKKVFKRIFCIILIVRKGRKG